ncbi:MAG: crosslink repair DNA glycosylase YcaQ family protein [Candidatus Nanopelagicales bacterium]
MAGRDRLTPDEARRGVLSAQGFTGGPSGAVGTRRLLSTLRRLGVVQVDSVNVVSRAHYLPFFSRSGPYDRSLLDTAAGRAPRRVTEYWAHEASIIPTETLPLFGWRMAEDHPWGSVSQAARSDPALLQAVIDAMAAHGPLTVTRLEKVLEHDAPRPTSHWGWNWSLVKQIVEHLFWVGELAAAGRDSQFRRRYGLPADVLPPSVVQAPRPEPADAIRQLVARAAAALGVATLVDLRDWFRLPAGATRTAVAELVDTGELTPVAVPGWPPAWRHRSLVIPRQVDTDALLAPFDPLIWERSRVERLFGMRYRIEIYVPQAKREFGYYVLPFLSGDRLAARVDLKADRGAGRLLVQSAWAHDPAPDTAERLAAELFRLGAWLGVPEVVVRDRGDLAAALTTAVAAGS